MHKCEHLIDLNFQVGITNHFIGSMFPSCRSPIDSNRGGGFKPIGCKVYISNLPFEAKWQNVKDLFTENVSQFLFNNIEVDFRYDINKTADP